MEFLIPIITMMVLMGSVALVVYGISQIRAGHRIFSVHGFLATYMHAAMLAALLILAIGTGSLINAGLSRWVGAEFSYGHHPARAPIDSSMSNTSPETGASNEVGGHEREQRRLDEAYRSGLARGIALGVVGLLLYAVHQIIWTTISPEENRWRTRMAFLAVLLVVFGFSGIIMIPVAIVRVLDYVFEATGDYHDGPGEVASMAVAFAPVWVGTLMALVRGRARAPEGPDG